MREEVREEKEGSEKMTFKKGKNQKVLRKSSDPNSKRIPYNRVLTEQRLQECTKCGKNFGWHSDLILHEQIHSGEKLCVCNECGKAFKTKNQLSMHQIIHTGEKPFHCAQCARPSVVDQLFANIKKNTVGRNLTSAVTVGRPSRPGTISVCIR